MVMFLLILLLHWFGNICEGSSSFRFRRSRGLSFIHEPPFRVDFSNTTGAVIPCSASGEPQPAMWWESRDGIPVSILPDLRQVRPDGSLVFLPFGPDQFRPGVHDGVYRCVVANSAGRIRSRDVHVKAVMLQPYDVHVYHQFVLQGNTAVLRCHVPANMFDYIRVTLWIRDDGVTIGSPGESGDKYAVLPTGELLVKNAGPSDALRSYHCQIHDRLTGEAKRSSTAGKLTVKEPFISLPARITESKTFVRVREMEQVHLPCVSEGHPPPQHWWFRKEKDSLMALSRGHHLIRKGEILVLQQALIGDGGAYECFVNNSIGEDRVTTELMVTAPLSVHVEPPVQAVDVGRRATLSCRVSGHPVQNVRWVKDGRQLLINTRVSQGRGNTLDISSVKREDKGMYQCLAENDGDMAQDSAEVYIEEDPPVLISTFVEHSVRPGTPVSLRCTASGNPLPQITWELDGQPVPEAFRVRIGDYVSEAYNVNSYVNISSASVEDAGTYACVARNEVGIVSHSGRLNVFGSPFIRSMNNITALASHSLTVHCPVAGYPIQAIYWEREGRRLPQNHRQRLFPNGTLIVQALQAGVDSGTYTCVAEGKDNNLAHKDVTVIIMNPPAVGKFSFPTELTSGERAAVACVVSAGDLPIAINWMKDGEPLSDDLHPMVAMVNDFMSSLSFPSVNQRHTGNYTCVATNPVASANYTTEMVVKVPPQWTRSPTDRSVVMGDPVVFDCQASGYPQPVIRWLKASSDGQSEFQVVVSSANIQSLENGSLAIIKTSLEDAGRFMCQATNGIGPGISVVVQLTLHVAAKVQHKFQAWTVKGADAVVLECRAFGDRPIIIRWTKDRKELDLSEIRYGIEEEITTNSIHSVLRIRSAERRDSSLFTCHATNAYGKDQTDFQVIVRERPDPPRDVHITRSGSRTISVSWSHPYSGNSPISKYLLECKHESEHWDSRKSISTDGEESSFLIPHLLPQTTYNIRLRAENAIGASDPSDTVTITTDDEAPSEPPSDVAVVATSSTSLRITWKPPQNEERTGAIEGYYVGYKVDGVKDQFNYKTVATGGTLTHEAELANLQKFTKYRVVVQAFNRKGAGPTSEEISSQTLEFDPPNAPYLRLLSATASTIQMAWDSREMDLNPITGYIIFHKGEKTEWTETSIPSSRTTYTFRGLHCGSRYQFYILSYNKAGRGPPGDVISVKTEGTAPIAPDKRLLLKVNSTAVSIHLSSWKSGGCPITYFTLQYKPRDGQEWILVSNNVSPDEKAIVISDLTSATWYTIFITSHSDAGATEAEYVIATLTMTGVTVSPLPVSPGREVDILHHLKIIIPVVCTAIVLVIIVTVACVMHMRLRSNGRDMQPGQPEERENEANKVVDSVPLSVWEKRAHADIQLHHSREQLYFPSPYATSRISVFSTNDELEGLPPPAWRHETTLDGEHTYEVPFPSKQPSLESPEPADVVGRHFCWAIHNQPDVLDVVNDNSNCIQLFLSESVPLNSKQGYIYLHPVRHPVLKRTSRRTTDRETEATTKETLEMEKFYDSGYIVEGDNMKRTYMLNESVSEDSSDDLYEISDAECDMYLQVVRA